MTDTSAPATAAAEQGQDPTAATITATAPVPAPPATTAQQAGQQDDQGAEWDGKIESLPDPVQKLIRDARGEAAKDRTNAKQQAADQAKADLAQTIGKALGLVQDDEQVDPDKLTGDLQNERDGHRATRVELAVYKASGASGANPDRLLDSRSFLASIKDIDPEDTDAVADAIKTAIDKDTSLKARVAAGVSSADHTGGSGEGATTKEQFDAMTGAERNELARTNRPLYDQLSGRSS